MTGRQNLYNKNMFMNNFGKYLQRQDWWYYDDIIVK